MTILAGKATLELHPSLPFSDEWMPRHECLAVAAHALLTADAPILTALLGYNDPNYAVEVALPSDGSLDLAALQRDLTARLTDALTQAKGGKDPAALAGQPIEVCGVPGCSRLGHALCDRAIPGVAC